MLNKPVGYVSGQEEHQHVPAVRLLTRDNIHLVDFDEEERQFFSARDSGALRFDRWMPGVAETLSGYAAAGRLDIDSTGVMIFTRAGIMARRLIEPESRIRKVYIVKVEPAVQPTSRERELGLTNLPRPTSNLSVLLKKGNRLLDAKSPLKPLVAAEWTDQFTMRLVMVEGRKRQIRHMCRQLLGWHVVELQRASVGPVQISSVPEGKWRPLTQDEMRSIFRAKPVSSKRPMSKRKKSRRVITG